MDVPGDALATMVAEWRIRDVVARYARAVDRRDGDLLRGCFHADAVTHFGAFDGNLDEFVPWVQAEVSRYTRTMHFHGPTIIDWPADGPGACAVAETYAIALHSKDGGEQSQNWVSGIRYIDRFESRTDSGPDDSWKIVERTVVGEWLRIDPTAGHRRFGKAMPTGRGARDDLVFQVLAEVFAPSTGDLPGHPGDRSPAA